MNLVLSKNFIVLVSTLVATVTCAAGFTKPGVYNSSESDGDVGMATMLRDKGFHIFVFCDTIAIFIMGLMDLRIDFDMEDDPPRIKRLSTISLLIILCKGLLWNQTAQDYDNDDYTIFKDSDMYVAARIGDLDDFERALRPVSVAGPTSVETLSNVSPAGNTYLHTAARYGNEEIVTFIAEMKPSLLLSKNIKGETALHLAAKTGQETTVRALVEIHQRLLPEDGINNLLRAENERGNTALHEALSNGQDSVAQYLINKDHELSYHQNKDGEYALYLAAKAGLANCVSLILELSTDQERVNEQFKKKSPIQAAIRGKHRGVLEAMFEKDPSLIQSKDDEGRNPLHYAASLGYLEEVRYLLNQYTRNATQRDNNGSFPIHLTSIEGHVDVVGCLLRDCPYPWELLDGDGCNILHLAAKHGRSNVVSFVLKNHRLKSLLNMKDKSGNVPLHFAAMNWHSKIVSALTWDKRVDVKLVNDKGMTALDVAEYYMSNNPPFTQRLTWAALKAAGTPRSLSGKTVGRKKSSIMDNYKERVNTLLVVSILVATVTFAAGFTVPGGYDSSESSGNLGMATMLREKGFHIFVFCDTIAMYSSIVVSVALIYAQLGDLTVMLDALILAVPLLGVALGMMSMAFAAGIFVAVSKLRWLATAVLVMGITFVVILFLLVLPLCVSLTSRNRVLRYLSYYPFRLMMLIVGSS